MHEVFDRFPTTNLASHSDSAGKKRNRRRENLLRLLRETWQRFRLLWWVWNDNYSPCSNYMLYWARKNGLYVVGWGLFMLLFWSCSGTLPWPAWVRSTNLIIGPGRAHIPLVSISKRIQLTWQRKKLQMNPFHFICSSTNILYLNLPLFRSNYNPTGCWMGGRQLCAFCHLFPPRVK